MQAQHEKRVFTTEVEEGFVKDSFNFGGGKYKTTKQHPLLDPAIPFRDCVVQHNQSKLAKHVKFFFLTLSGSKHILTYLNYSVVNF